MRTPDALILASGALVAWGRGVGLPGTAVAAVFAAGAWLDFCGAAVGAAELVVLATGVDVAEDPQANSRATNSRTMALGRYLLICGLNGDFGILDLLLVFLATMSRTVSRVCSPVSKYRIDTSSLDL